MARDHINFTLCKLYLQKLSQCSLFGMTKNTSNLSSLVSSILLQVLLDAS